MSIEVHIDQELNTEIIITRPNRQVVEHSSNKVNLNEVNLNHLEFNDKILFENIKNIKDSLKEATLDVDFKDFIRFLDLHIGTMSEERESLLKEVSELREKVGGLLLESGGNEKAS